MRVTIFGSGYVGLVTGACFADVGNEVCCVDIDEERIKQLNLGNVPIYEPGLTGIIQTNIKSKRLSFTSNIDFAVGFADLIFIAVGTPQDEDGSADVSSVLKVAGSITKSMTDDKYIVIKSTVPVGTSEQVEEFMSSRLSQLKSDLTVSIASNPEFLKEGCAINDFMKPDRIIIGSLGDDIKTTLKELYKPFNRNHQRIMFMDPRSSELTKYVANSMLAAKVSFMNEMSNIAERLGADIESVREGIGSDTRIGYSFIYPGPGFGGSCFPKDIKALIKSSKDVLYEPKMLQAIDKVNTNQKGILYKKIDFHFNGELDNKTICLWGLSFKPDTDDMRESPSLPLIDSLIESGASVRVYDPEAMDECRKIYKGNKNIFYATSPIEAAESADALVVVTEWKEFRTIDIEKLKEALNHLNIFDGRNIYNPDLLESEGFVYFGIGRGKSIYN
jgi:UDPglucose 6-dehydrogenase